MIAATIMLCLLCQVGNRISCQVELNTHQVISGDLIYLKTKFCNSSAQPQKLPSPTYCMNHWFLTKYGGKSHAMARDCGGFMGVNTMILEPNECLEETIILSPWEVFQDDELRPLGISVNTLLVEPTRTKGLDFSLSWTDFTSSKPVRHEIPLGEKLSVLDSECILKSKLPIDDLFGWSSKIPTPVIPKPAVNYQRTYGSGGPVERMAPVTFSFFGAPIHPYFSLPDNFRVLRNAVRPESTLGHLVELIHIGNTWVQTQNEESGIKLEHQMRDFVRDLPPVEREYLAKRLDALIATKEQEHEGGFINHD